MPADAPEVHRGLRFMQSRIPVLDTLVAFVPSGSQPSAAVAQALEHAGQSRWFPEPGGHRVAMPYEGWAYDTTVLERQPGGWDHEHCRGCQCQVPANTLCWVTESGAFLVLCCSCHTALQSSEA